MSRLRDLMEELCPNGVEYKKLGDVLRICNGSDYKKFGAGTIPVYGSGGIMTYIDTYVYDEPSVLIPRKGSLDKLYYVDVPFWTVDTIFYTKISKIVSPRFVFFYLQTQHLERLNKAGGVPSLTQSVLNKIRIPVPPLDIQNEIVKLLDNFTKLTAELTAELTLREKQYNFYRDSLLNFVRMDDTIVQTDRQTDRQAQRISNFGLCRKEFKVEWKTLGEVCTLVSGGDVPKEAFSQCFTGVYNIPIYSNGVRGKDLYGFTNVPRITQPCVTIAARGTIGYSALRMKPFYPVIRLICAIPCEVVDVKYLFYILQMTAFKTPRTGIPQLTIPMVRCYPIPVPPLEIQKKIVSILDRFDALCNDLTSGLPAEIAARKKQYEHYRDKLLTFPRSKLEERR